MWAPKSPLPAVFRLPPHLLGRILTFASSIDEDIAMEERLSDKHNLPEGQSLLLSAASGEGCGGDSDCSLESSDCEESSVGSPIEFPIDESPIESPTEPAIDSSLTDDTSPYHPTSRLALCYALVCKHWYHIAQPLVFRHLRVNDKCNWALLAHRLTQPVCASAPGFSSDCCKRAASYVKWLDVKTANFHELKQVALVHMLVNMEALVSFVLNTTVDGDDLDGELYGRLTSQSTFISLFCAAISKTCSKVTFLSLTISMDHSAIRPLIHTLATLTKLRALVIRHDASMDHTRRLLNPQDRLITLPHLHTLLYESLRDGNYPLLSHIGRWSTPQLSSLMMISRNPIIGGGLIVYRNIGHLEQLELPRGYFYPEMSIPRCPMLSHLSIHYCHLPSAFSITYHKVTYIGIQGRIFYITDGQLHLDVVALSCMMRRFARRRYFPRLDTVQLLDIDSETLFSFVWSHRDGTLWCCWNLILQDRGVEFIDRNGQQLLIVPPRLNPSFSLIPSRALMDKWLASLFREKEPRATFRNGYKATFITNGMPLADSDTETAYSDEDEDDELPPLA